MPSRNVKITKRSIDGLKPGEIAWDTEIAGFGARCQRRDKVYILKTREGRRQRWFTIGKHGAPWTPDLARREARKILGEIAAGKNPATKRDADAKIQTMDKVAEAYLSEEIEPKKKPATAIQYRDFLERVVLPKIGKHLITDIVFKDVSALHHSLRDRPATANRVLAVLSSMFNWCERQGVRDRKTNPTVGVEKYKEGKRERFLSAAELANLGGALAELKDQESPYVIAAIKLLVFTGARRDEILDLKWKHVDFENTVLWLPDSKTGQKPIYLNAPALETLSNIPRVSGNDYVIVGAKPGERLVNLRKPWLRICGCAGLEDVRLHDLRHSFASVGVSGGATLPIVGKLLGHTKAATTERYSHLANDPVRAANEAIGREIAARMGGMRGDVVAGGWEGSG